MDIILAITGLVLGLFLWSNILGSIFATMPVQLKMKKAGVINEVSWLMIIVPVLLSGAVIVASAIFWQQFFIGSMVAGVIMLFNIGKLKGEALENFQNDQKRKNS